MQREVPLHLVRLGHSMMVVGTVVAIWLRLPWLIYSLYTMVALGVVFGPVMSLPVQLGRLIFGHRLFYADTEAAEITRFNQIISFTFMGVSTLILATTGHWIGYLFAGCVTLAASAALCGYCIGCTVYFRYKMRTYKIRSHRFWGRVLDLIEGRGTFVPPLRQRYQPLLVLGLAHEAFRNAIAEVETAAGTLDRHSLAHIVPKVNDLVRAIALHADQEDQKFFPLLDQKKKGLVDPFGEEHRQGQLLERRMQEGLAAARANADMGAMSTAAQAIAEWSRFHLAHLKHEETRIQARIVHLLTHDEAMAILHEVLKWRPDEFRTFLARYIFDRLGLGQRFTFASVLLDALEPNTFKEFESILRPIAGDHGWRFLLEDHQGAFAAV